LGWEIKEIREIKENRERGVFKDERSKIKD
jgi:hypothetical protein